MLRLSTLVSFQGASVARVAALAAERRSLTSQQGDLIRGIGVSDEEAKGHGRVGGHAGLRGLRSRWASGGGYLVEGIRCGSPGAGYPRYDLRITHILAETKAFREAWCEERERPVVR